MLSKLPIARFLVVGCFALLVLFFIYPLLRLVTVPFLSYDNTGELVKKLTENPSQWRSLKTTLLFATATTFFSILLAVPAAWLVTRTNLLGASKFKSWLSFPYAIPPFVGAIAWIYLANPTNGLLNQIIGKSIFNIYSVSGLIFVETSFLYTYVLLSLTSALEQMDPSLEEAARVAGASPKKVFFQITLPLVKPALISSGILVFLATLASFGIPALIGGPAGIRVVTTEIYQLQKMGTTSGIQSSILLSSFLFTISMILILISQMRLFNSGAALVTGKSARSSQIDLGSAHSIWFGFVVLIIGITLILPFLGILLSATSLIQGNFGLANFTLSHFSRTLFHTDELWRALSNSIIIGVAVAVTCCVLAIVFGYIRSQTRFALRSLIDLFIALPYSAPGTVIALALIIAFSQNFFGLPFSIYNTMWLFILAYTLKFSNFSYRLVGDNFSQIHPHLIEAAQVAGASKFQVILKIWIPLLKPSLIASFFLVLVPALTELTMSVFLTGPGLETLGTLIYQMQDYSDNIGGSAAVLSVLVFLFVIVMNVVVKKTSHGKYGL